MSSFMVSNKTRSIIAGYLACCANYPQFRYDCLSDILLGSKFMKLLKNEGCYDEDRGMFSVEGVYNLLTRENRKALVARYGEEDAAEMSGDTTFEAAFGGIDVSSNTMRDWMVNLFSVARCYLYQIAEGDYEHNPFYREFGRWVENIAHVLAVMMEHEVRPQTGPKAKRWGEF